MDNMHKAKLSVKYLHANAHIYIFEIVEPKNKNAFKHTAL